MTFTEARTDTGEKFRRPVEIVICTDCAQVLSNGTGGWGLDESGRELGEVHAERMRDTDATVCLDGDEHRPEPQGGSVRQTV